MRERRRALTVWALTLALAVASTEAAAADIAVPGTDTSVAVHGFVSPGFIVTTGNNFLAKSKRGSFEFTEVGLNFTAPLTEKLRAGIQLFARDLGPLGSYAPRADWFYLDYRFEDYFGIRAGRVKLPFGLYNDTSDIDVARVPILLPQSVYPLASRDFLLAQTGAEAYGHVNLRQAGAFEYRLYGGTIFVDGREQSNVTAAFTEIDVPYVVGQRLMWETPVEGLRVAGSLQALRIDGTIALPAANPPVKPLSIGIPAKLWVGSLEYTRGGLLLAAEYSRWILRSESSNTALLPITELISERGYGMASYRVTPWLTPGAYYSLFFPNVDQREGRAQVQHDVAGTLRFDVNSHWLVKLEGHFMSGTALLNSSLNDGKSLASLEKNWGVFLVKTTAYF